MKKVGIFISLSIVRFVGNFSQAGFLGDNSELFSLKFWLFLIIFVILFVIVSLVVNKFVKKKKNSIVVQYAPPKGIDSAKAGLLLYRRSDQLFITSLIYKWIGDGLVSIAEKKNHAKKGKDKNITYILHKNSEIPEIAPSYELLFWKSLFDSGETVEIDENIELNFEPSLNAMEEYGYNSGWFVKKNFMDEPRFFVMCILIVLMVLLWKIPNSTENKEYMSLFLLVLYVILCCFPKIRVLVGIEIPKLKKMKISQKGENLVSHILGYREFLRTCDAEVLKTFLKQDPLYFDKILSYAIVFGIESELIEKLNPFLDSIGLKLYFSKFDNPFYNILNKNGDEHSVFSELCDSTKILGGESWWGFK